MDKLNSPIIKIAILFISINFLNPITFHAQTTTIKVYSDSIKHTIPYFGYNYIYANRGGKLIKLDTTWDAVRKQAAVDMSPGWLRFPGGTIANLYKWKGCIGPVVNRFGMHGYTLKPDDSFFGTDEAAQLAEEAGAENLFVVGGNTSAQYAADWVEYVNAPVGANPNGGIDYAQKRANNGHPAPYNVKFWEIVNEGGNGLVWPRWNENLDPVDNGSSGQYPFANTTFRNWAAFGGSKSFYDYKAVTNSAWKDSYIILTGVANEKRYTKLAPVVRDSVKVRIGTDISNSVEWTMVTSFATSYSTDKHYTLDETIGEITFGDGINGMIPPNEHFVFTDFAIENYDGHEQIYNAMKAIDSTIEIASGYAFMDEYTPNSIDGSQSHGGMGAPNPYPSDQLYANLSKVMGEYTFKYYEKKGWTSLPLFVTEIGTNGLDMEGSMFSLLLFAKAASWGDQIQMIGSNYLLSTIIQNECHINHEQNGSIIQGPGYVNILFNKYFGKKYIKSSSENMPTHTVNYYKNSWNNTLYSEPLDKVYVVSSMNVDSSKMYIMCINTTKIDSIQTNIQIITNDQLQVADFDTTVILKASSLTSINTQTNPNEISIVYANQPQFVNDTIINYLFEPASATVFVLDMTCPNGISQKKTNTFIGSNSEWFDPENWSLGYIPGLCHDVIIPTNKTVIITNDKVATCNTLCVKPGAIFEVTSKSRLEVLN